MKYSPKWKVRLIMSATEDNFCVFDSETNALKMHESILKKLNDPDTRFIIILLPESDGTFNPFVLNKDYIIGVSLYKD